MRGVLLDVYNTMGPLLKEEYYRDAIVIGLEKRRIKNEPEKDFGVYYDGDARDFFMSGAELVARSQVDLEKTYWGMGNVIRDLKKHTADRLIRHHRAAGDKSLLDFLASVVTRPEKQQYKVWENGYFAKDVFSAEFLRQKMIYVHNNPCQSHWNLAERPEDYIWSSAGFYLIEEPAIIPLDNANFLLA